MPSTPLLRLAAVLVGLAAAAPAQFTVTATSPANNARGVSPAEPVTITFSQPVHPLTVTPQNIRLAGRWSGPVPGTLSIGPGGTSVTFRPSRPLFATEIATLSVSRAVASTAAAPLTGGFHAAWWVDAAPSTGTFVLDHVVDYRNAGEGLIRTYGFFAGDVDRDGSPDMSSTNEVSFDVRLMKNDGCGHFGPKVVSSLPTGTEPSPNEGGDFNGDGWIDLATGNQNGGSVAVFLNNGAGNYLPPTVTPIGGSVHGLAVLDADADGDLDIAATNQSDIVLLRNNGNGTFLPPVLLQGGNGEWALQAGDANGDGRPDLFCGAAWSQDVTLLLGNGAGGFTPSVTRSCGGFPWQMALGDVDGDGNLDCVVAEATNGRAAVLRGDGLGGLLPAVSYPVGSNPVSVDIGDLEGDDDLDIVVASFSNGNATLLRNDGTGTFGNASTIAASSAGSCAVIVDHDRDGDTDVILVDELDDKGFVWRQDGPGTAGVQPPTCDAALRINSFANRGGFAGALPHHLPGDRFAFVNVSGQPGQLVATFFGVPLPAGAPTPWGLLNLAAPLDLFFSGFLGDPLGALDANGETMIPVPIPPGLPTGLTLTLQSIVSTPTNLALGNPEQIVF
ncbi:MAG: VCBS repeat-containing protein [Planctomycetes bacterium]|nr:VCBS repeat-containing protein [Planctomycetota bacterium]